jgi:hypothetical protein
LKTKEFLRQYYWLDRSIRAEVERRDAWRRLAEGSPNVLRKDFGASSQGDRVSHFVAKAADLSEIIDRRVAKLLRLKKEVVLAIDTVEDPKLNEILKRRYIDLWAWGDIAEEMGYSRRYVWELHGEALRQVKIPAAAT